jgi:hypothetical protein
MNLPTRGSEKALVQRLDSKGSEGNSPLAGQAVQDSREIGRERDHHCCSSVYFLSA